MLDGMLPPYGAAQRISTWEDFLFEAVMGENPLENRYNNGGRILNFKRTILDMPRTGAVVYIITANKYCCKSSREEA